MIIIYNNKERNEVIMVYLVYGEQFPLVSKRVKKLINSILKDGIDEFNYIRINARETLVQDIAYECNLLPFMGNKVVRIDNPYFLLSSKESNRYNRNITKLLSKWCLLRTWCSRRISWIPSWSNITSPW